MANGTLGRRVFLAMARRPARRFGRDLARTSLVEISEVIYGMRAPEEVSDLDGLRVAVRFGDLTAEIEDCVQQLVARLTGRPKIHRLALSIAQELLEDRQLADDILDAMTGLDDDQLSQDILRRLINLDIGYLGRVDRALVNAKRLDDIQTLMPHDAALLCRLMDDLPGAVEALERAHSDSVKEQLLTATQLHCMGEPDYLLALIDSMAGPSAIVDLDMQGNETIGLLFACGLVSSRVGDRAKAIEFLEAAWARVKVELGSLGMPFDGANVALELARLHRQNGTGAARRDECLRAAVDEWCRSRLAISDPVQRAKLATRDVWIDELLKETIDERPALAWRVIEAYLQSGIVDVLQQAIPIGGSSVELRQAFRQAWSASMPPLAELQRALPESTALLVLCPMSRHCPGEFCGFAVVVDRMTVRGWRFGFLDDLANAVESAELPDMAMLGDDDLAELGRHLLPTDWQHGHVPKTLVVVASESLTRVPLHAARLGDC